MPILAPFFFLFQQRFISVSLAIHQEMKKIVLKLDLHDDKDKQKAMRVVSTIQGIDSIGIDMKERKMTVIGLVDPVSVVTKLRKFWQTSVVFIGPAKEKKQEEPKKEEPKKEEAKEEKKEEKKDEKKEEEPKKEENKEEPKKEEEKKEEAKKEKKEPPVQTITEFGNPYKTYYHNPYMTYNPYMNNNPYYMNNNPYMSSNPYPATQYYYVQSAQENPNSCTIF